MEERLERLLTECRSYTKEGKLADYIPELSKANPDHLGICLVGNGGKTASAGDDQVHFTIQSIIKPVLLLQALLDNGVEAVRAKVGVEATGKPFDAINVTDQKLARGNLNPMVNMGAIVMCTLIHGESFETRFRRVLELTRLLADNPGLSLDEEVYRSEKRTGSKNRALAYLLKSSGVLEGDVEEVLDCYFRACSIRVTCRDLARIGSVLAGHGTAPNGGTPLFPPEYAIYVNAVLMTCGMYDGSGDFAVRVGVPAKSGVGGGIMAVVPSRMGIGIYAPSLDAKGNSVAGIHLLERLSQKLELSIF